ncbi:MAG: dihydropteroate synthase [Acidobacteriaceae bacterium]
MAFVRRPLCEWRLRSCSLTLGTRTLIMGVLNVTPDSFSDGGLYANAEAAAERALAMLDEGADLIDIGGESTRPGLHAMNVTAQEEQARVLPVIEAVLHARPHAVLSVDTWKAQTARAAMAAGAEIVNDISGFTWDPAMPDTCAALTCGVVLMHTRGRPPKWRTQPRLDAAAVLPLVRDGLEHSLDLAQTAGIARDRIVLDPGYGFGKAFDNNYPLFAHQDDLLALGRPLLVGVSRKSFLGRTAGAARGGPDLPVEERGAATLAAITAAILAGASIIRVHEVRPAVDAAAIADAILAAL